MEDGRGLEVVERRRRRGLPLERARAPRVARRAGTGLERGEQVDHRDEYRDAEDERADRRELVKELVLLIVVPVAPRHAARAHHELRQERQVEAEEHARRADLAEALRVHAAGELRPPVVERAEERDQRRAHHHVVEVGDDEVGVVQVDVDGQRPEEQAGQAADREQQQERQRVQHRGLEPDVALVERGHPVEDLDRGGDADRERQRREHHVREAALAGHEHVVAPHEERQQCERDTRVRNEPVAEHRLARERGDQLADHTHRRDDHDVDGRV